MCLKAGLLAEKLNDNGLPIQKHSKQLCLSKSQGSAPFTTKPIEVMDLTNANNDNFKDDNNKTESSSSGLDIYDDEERVLGNSEVCPYFLNLYSLVLNYIQLAEVLPLKTTLLTSASNTKTHNNKYKAVQHPTQDHTLKKACANPSNDRSIANTPTQLSSATLCKGASLNSVVSSVCYCCIYAFMYSE